MKNIELETNSLDYKLVCWYYGKTELYDRSLTDKRSPYDKTEAFIDGSDRCLSNKYASSCRKVIKHMIPFTTLIKIHNEYHYSAQRWVDEYERLLEAGEYFNL